MFSGIDAVQVLSQMSTGNAAIRREFLERARRVDEIRSAVYLSGTLVRDYLLEPDPKDAESQLIGLHDIRQKMNAELRDYADLLPPGETDLINSLQTEIDVYWHLLEPAFHWTPEQRREQGYSFLRTEVFPRRTSMLRLADRIGGINTRELTEGDRRLSEMFMRFRNRLLAVLALTVGLGVMLAGLSMGRILRLERETERHLQAVTQARGELRELSARLVEAQERERKALSRELHDAVGQSLSAALLELRNVSASLPADAGALGRVESARHLVENAVGMARNMALLLRPSMLDDLGLMPAVEWHAREVRKRTGLSVNVQANGDLDELSEDQKTCVYRVVQEALHNVVQHANAKTVRISIEHNGPIIHVTIQDDGKGFDPSRKGLGLIGIQERVENLNGKTMIRSEPGRGTMIEVQIPFQRGPESRRSMPA